MVPKQSTAEVTPLSTAESSHHINMLMLDAYAYKTRYRSGGQTPLSHTLGYDT